MAKIEKLSYYIEEKNIIIRNAALEECFPSYMDR
jgi:hypothetical protein